MATLLRVGLIAAVAYLILIKYNAFATAFIFIVATVLDALDGYLAVKESSNGKVSFIAYTKAALTHKNADEIKKYKSKAAAYAKFGPRIDIAGDRFAEYSLFIVFAYVRLIPVYVVLAVVLLHSFADALMGSRGTSSKMKSKFAAIVYTSNASRAGINVAKILAFSYLILVYSANYPVGIGYALLCIMLGFIFIRGIAEIYECLVD